MNGEWVFRYVRSGSGSFSWGNGYFRWLGMIEECEEIKDCDIN